MFEFSFDRLKQLTATMRRLLRLPSNQLLNVLVRKGVSEIGNRFKEEIGDADDILHDKLIFHEHQLIFHHFTPISFYMTISS